MKVYVKYGHMIQWQEKVWRYQRVTKSHKSANNVLFYFWFYRCIDFSCSIFSKMYISVLSLAFKYYDCRHQLHIMMQQIPQVLGHLFLALEYLSLIIRIIRKYFGGAMVIMVASNTVDRWFEPRSNESLCKKIPKK